MAMIREALEIAAQFGISLLIVVGGCVAVFALLIGAGAVIEWMR